MRKKAVPVDVLLREVLEEDPGRRNDANLLQRCSRVQGKTEALSIAPRQCISTPRRRKCVHTFGLGARYRSV